MTLTYRCTICLVRYPRPGERGDGLPQPYVCLGGWPSANNPRAEPVYHVPRATERIPE